jgi:hypothetical protein
VSVISQRAVYVYVLGGGGLKYIDAALEKGELRAMGR